MIIAILASLYLLLQILFMRLLNIYLPAVLLPLPTIDLYDAISEFNRLGYFRAQSFFSEPSVYAQYVLPAYCITLFEREKGRRNNVAIIILSAGIIASTSSMGILGIAILWFLYLWEYYRKNLPKIIGYSILAFAAFLILMNSNEYIYKSINEILFSTASSGKTSTRILRGFAVYVKLPLFNKIFGTGLGNGDAYISLYSIVTNYESKWGTQIVEYFNNIAAAFIYGGVFGGVSFVLTQLSYIKSDRKAALALSITFLAMSVAGFMFFNVLYLLFAAIILYLDQYADLISSSSKEYN